MPNLVQQFVNTNHKAIIQTIKQVAKIPAPSFEEAKKIRFLQAIIKQYKFLKNITIDMVVKLEELKFLKVGTAFNLA